MNLKDAIEKDLYNNVIKFSELLIDQFPENTDLVAYKTMLEKFFSPTTFTQEFCKHVLPYKNEILTKQKDKLLDELKKDETLFYQLTKILEDPSFTPEDTDNTWKWLNKFVSLGIKYSNIN